MIEMMRHFHHVFSRTEALDLRVFINAYSINGGTQGQFLENICSEDDLRSRIFVTFVLRFLACLPLLGFSNI